MPMKWKTDFSKFVITSNFERRGWKEVQEEGDDDWNVYWAAVATIREIFSQDSILQLRDDQLLNHFPNHYELTRKDLLVKNMKRYQRQMRKAGASAPHILPSTFVLPQEYAMFVEEFRKQGGNCTYILKPNSKAQGKGIFLVNKLSQVRAKAAAAAVAAAASRDGSSAGVTIAPLFGQQSSSKPGTSSSRVNASTALRPALENYVVSRYIDTPLLLGGKKFDLRLYVLVPSYKPLVVYLSTLGFARFCNVKYTKEVVELDNMYVHLTNVAIQKGGGSDYNTAHGNKWALSNLRLHLEATRGHEATTQLFADIQQLVMHTLKSVQQVMVSDKHCFELYGFDIIIDSNLQPWLIEVNASPSLTTTTKADRSLKFKVINDALSIVIPPSWASSRPDGSSNARAGNPTRPGRQERHRVIDRCFPQALGCMQLIYDERDPSNSSGSRRTTEQAAQAAAASAAARTAGGGDTWQRDICNTFNKVVLLHG